MNTDVILIIIGEVSCALCGATLTQADVTAEQIMGIGDSQGAWLHFCAAHFYVTRHGQMEEAGDYEANMARLAKIVLQGRQQAHG